MTEITNHREACLIRAGLVVIVQKMQWIDCDPAVVWGKERGLTKRLEIEPAAVINWVLFFRNLVSPGSPSVSLFSWLRQSLFFHMRAHFTRIFKEVFWNLMLILCRSQSAPSLLNK